MASSSRVGFKAAEAFSSTGIMWYSGPLFAGLRIPSNDPFGENFLQTETNQTWIEADQTWIETWTETDQTWI